VEPADSNRDARIPEKMRDVEGAGILVGLDPDQKDKPEIAMMPQPGDQLWDDDARIRLVDRLEIDGDVPPKNAAFGTVGSDAVDSGERVGGDHRPPPSYYIAVVVVVRRFD
jgi:hypothetical protein